MIPFAITSAIVSVTCIYFGFYVFILDSKSELNRSFLYFFIFFALWSGSFVVLNLEITASERTVWLAIAYIFNLCFPIPLLRYCLILTGRYQRIRYKKLLMAGFCVLPAVFLYRNFFIEPIFQSYPNGIWYYFSTATIFIYNSIACVIIVLWGYKSKLKRERIQTGIFVGSGFFTMILTTLSDLYIGYGDIPTIAPTLLIFLIVGLFVNMVKFRFMGLTPASVSNEIFNNIDESVVLLDSNGAILMVNKKTEEYVGIKDLNGKNLSAILMDYYHIEGDMTNILEGTVTEVSKRVRYIGTEENEPVMDIKCTTIKDTFGDILGVLIIGKEVKGLSHLKATYRLTDREAVIVQYLLDGANNNQIVELLGITDNTVKRHIANIYGKLHVKNRVELLNLINEFDFSEEGPVENRLLLVRDVY